MLAGRTAVGARNAALAKGRRKRAFMLGGFLWVAGQRACCGGGSFSIGDVEACGEGIDARSGFSGPGEMSGDGDASGVGSVVLTWWFGKSSHSCEAGNSVSRGLCLGTFPVILRSFARPHHMQL
jgi:hypothetical protein